MKVGITQNYCSGSANNTLVKISGVEFYFSYKTIIAFKVSGGLYIRENEWGPTTGKHLNAISDNKKIRMKGDDFESFLSKLDIKVSGLDLPA